MAQTERFSPPVVDETISDCAQAVAVSGLIAGATVRVYANGVEEVGVAVPSIGWWHIPTYRRLTINEVITAVQELGGDESYPTRKPVIVRALTSPAQPMPAPSIELPLYDCQQCVTVTNVRPGSRVEVIQPLSPADPPIGALATPVDVARVGTPRLHEDQVVAARQALCEGPPSGPGPNMTVKPKPTQLPPPTIDEYLPGATVLVVSGLVIGADVEIFAGGASVGGGVASSSSVAFSVSPIQANPKPQARQSLCEVHSPWSPEGQPLTTLPTPQIRQAVCPGATAVLVENTKFGALVTVTLNGRQVGQVTASGTDTLVTFGDAIVGATDDELIATAEAPGAVPAIPPQASPTVAVAAPGATDGPHIVGGSSIFEPAANEEPIPGPVFPRGRWTSAGPGPGFRVSVCGAIRAILTIKPPGNQPTFDLPLTQGPEGQFSAVWDWTKLPRQSIHVGRYEARFLVGSATAAIRADIPFFVIFDPSEVTAPTRFGFDSTAIWFGTPSGLLEASHYTLHLSDNRVFGWAISEIDGMTNQFQAAEKLAVAEHNRFGYSIDYHTKDVVDLLTFYNTAQCADDASTLTALLRAIGIPAHPVTVDARLEHGDASWPFDTWVEARLFGPTAGERWYALHSHSKVAAQGPVTRAVAGTTWWEADRRTNDMVVMAGPGWVGSEIADGDPDVAYNWDTPCKRPSKTSVVSKAWIENLTDADPDRYWTKPYWQCSPAWESPIDIVIDNAGAITVGEPVTGRVTVHNPGPTKLDGLVQLHFAESNPASMAFAEGNTPISETPIAVPPDGSVDVPFTFLIPASACADWTNFLVAYFGDDRRIHNVEVQSALSIEVTPVAELDVGDTAHAHVTLTNISNQPVSQVVLTFDLPAVLAQREPAEGGLTWRFPAIALGETQTAFCPILAVEPAEVTTLTLHVDTELAGRREIEIPVSVRDWRTDDVTRPSPTYQSESRNQASVATA